MAEIINVVNRRFENNESLDYDNSYYYSKKDNILTVVIGMLSFNNKKEGFTNAHY